MKFRSFYRIFFFKKMAEPAKQVINGLVFICLAAMSLSQSANAQAPIENIEQLRAKVAQFLTDEYRQTQAVKVEVKVGSLDNRLRLAKCGQNLALGLKDATKTGGNVSVQVVCSSTSSHSSRWTILVPAQARVYRSVAVAGRNLQRGDIVNESDLATDIKDVGDFRMGFSLTVEAIVGKEVKFAMTKGDVFRNSALDAPLVIRRGDTVSIESAAGDISVRTSATATTDGRIGQQIRVKNNQSARVVNAKVVGPGQVQSIL